MAWTTPLRSIPTAFGGKGKRRPEVEMRWRELLSGDAAMAAALNASPRPASNPAIEKSPRLATKRVPKKPPP
jgi:hypothetical protein